MIKIFIKNLKVNLIISNFNFYNILFKLFWISIFKFIEEKEEIEKR